MSSAVAPVLRSERKSKTDSPSLKTPDSARKKTLKLPKMTGVGSKNSLDPESNPFHIPSETQMFAMRDEERKLKNETREKMMAMKVYEKSSGNRKNFRQLLAEDADDIEFYDEIRKKGAEKTFMNRENRADRHFANENLHDFIGKKREMFLVQYALGVKREEMRKLDEIAQAEEQKLLDDEKALEEDAAKFDAFLKENDKNSVEAIKKAEQETKLKLEKIQDIKRLNIQILGIRSEMSKNEDQLKELQRYRQFLEKLTPKEFLEQNSKKKIVDGNAKTKKSVKKNVESGEIDDNASVKSEGLDESNDWDDEEEPKLYFQTPEQLLNIFAELEENNLALIQNCQESEETLEELRIKIEDTTKRMDQETLSLKQQVEFLNSAIANEEEKARNLEERTKMFSTGTIGAESQEQMLEELNVKVKEVYKKCIGDNDANLSTLTMLTNIENKLEQLLETIELMPPDKVEQAEKMKDKERRQRLRQEKLEAQRILQEERVQRALERAKAPVIKKTGKPVVFRSPPPQKKKVKEDDTKKKEEEDLEYYFS